MGVHAGFGSWYQCPGEIMSLAHMGQIANLLYGMRAFRLQGVLKHTPGQTRVSAGLAIVHQLFLDYYGANRT